jgi:multidrug efflux pump subunit AcrA (membrane-fusion protein)
MLATLDDRDLRLDRLRWASERERLDRRYRAALAVHDRPEMVLVGAQLRQAEAQLALTEYKLARTRINAPIGGVVVSGDLSQLVGSPVEEGKVLFEVAPLDGFRIALQVEEGDIRYLAPGQRGVFAPTGLSGATVPFVVTRITSVASVEDGQNSFRVEARLDGRSVGLRPGMEGVAKVTVGRASRLWTWTRGLRDWARLFAWRWLP